MPISGFLCIYGFSGGWPSIFYIFGFVGFLWWILFMFIASDNPQNHRFITKIERVYILEETKKNILKPKTTPWKEICCSKICIVLNLISFSFNFGFYFYLTQVPSYMKEVLKFDIEDVMLLYHFNNSELY
jgi:MFS transporter, ACS family, solute carrier family 17 (sodium-dependent inorganic phosphate cotransporter), member 5